MREIPLDSDMCKGNSVIPDPPERNVPRDGPCMEWLIHQKQTN